MHQNNHTLTPINFDLTFQNSPVEVWRKAGEQFLSCKDVTPSSLYTYKRQFFKFEEFLQTQCITKFDKSILLQYKNWLMDSGLKSTTINNYITAAKQVFKFLSEEFGIPDYTRNLKRVKVGNDFKKDCLTASEAKQLLESINCDTLEGKRDYCLILLCLTTSLRSHSVFSAKLSDLKQKNGHNILEVVSKGYGDRNHFSILCDSLMDSIKDYLSLRKPLTATEPLFTASNGRYKGCAKPLSKRTQSLIIKKRLKAIGLDNPRLSFGSLRHSAITFAVESTNVFAAKNMANHKNVQTTMTYSHIQNRFENAPEIKIEEMLKTA